MIIYHYHAEKTKAIFIVCAVSIKLFINYFSPFFRNRCFYFSNFLFSLVYYYIIRYLGNNFCACAILFIFNFSCIVFNTSSFTLMLSWFELSFFHNSYDYMILLPFFSNISLLHMSRKLSSFAFALPFSFLIWQFIFLKTWMKGL